MSNEKTSRALMRLILGELSPEEKRRLERRLEDEPELRGLHRRLLASWESLEIPSAPPVPADFRDGVMAAARRIGKGELSWSQAPAWARAGATAALTLGLVLGLGLGRLSAPPGVEELLPADAPAPADLDLEAYYEAELESGPLSLADAYWLELEASGDSVFEGGEATP